MVHVLNVYYNDLINNKNIEKNRAKTVAASVTKLLDESMSAWRPRKDKTGGLPDISFILQKPEPLGTEFKCMACSLTGIFFFILCAFISLSFVFF